jgi:hypothetical protein
MQLVTRGKRLTYFLLASIVVYAFFATVACTGLLKHTAENITPEFVKESTARYIKVLTSPHSGILQLRYTSFNPPSRFRYTKMHDTVWMFKKKGETVYFTHNQFESVEGDQTVDIDFWMVPFFGELRLIDIVIYKVNEKPWFTYEGLDIKSLASEDSGQH